jgi:hypothetical protein
MQVRAEGAIRLWLKEILHDQRCGKDQRSYEKLSKDRAWARGWISKVVVHAKGYGINSLQITMELLMQI